MITNIVYPRRVPKDSSFGQTPYVMPPLRLMRGADGAAGLNGADGGLGFKPSVGRYFSNSPNSTSYTTSTASVAHVAHLIPVKVEFDCTVDQIEVNVSTAIASSNIKVGIYRSDAAKRPSDMVNESAAVSTATGGIKACVLPSPVMLSKGEVVWVSIRHSHAGVLLSAPQLYACPTIDHGPSATTANKHIAKTGATFASAAPATWTYANGDLVATAAALVALRIAG